MYEYYDYENRVVPDEKEKLQAQMKERAARELKAQKKEKRKKWFMCVAYALVFGLIAGGTFQAVNLAGDLIRNKAGIGKSGTDAVSETKDKEQTTQTARRMLIQRIRGRSRRGQRSISPRLPSSLQQEPWTYLR